MSKKCKKGSIEYSEQLKCFSVGVGWEQQLKASDVIFWDIALCLLTFRHRASCILGQAFHCSPENAFLYLINKYISLSDICLTVRH